MSLADELQADLDLLEGGDDEQEEEEQQETVEDQDMNVEDQPGEEDGMEGVEEEEDEKDRIEKIEMAGLDDVKKVSKLMQGKAMQEVLKKIAFYKLSSRDPAQPIGGPVEEDPEYKLIVQANSLTVDIDTEILAVHKFIRDHYNKKFPELESLVLNSLDYAHAVKAIGREMDITRVDLRPILPSATIMVVTVTGSTTNGRELTEREWAITEEACDLALELDGARRTIIEYVESRMSFIAPNLSLIVGSATAAKMLGAAGGLTALSKMPACNVQVLGAVKRAATGFSNVTAKRHTGYIYQSEVCTRAPADLRMKIQRMAAAKCVLAARIDRGHASMDGSAGRKMREEIDHKIEKMQEAPPSKTIKALPAPDDAPKKRRGGRRARQQKEAYAVTELRQAQNRMSFGVAEDETVGSFGSTKGLGLIGQQTGKIRASAVDSRTKVKAPKSKSYGSSGTTSGLSSSLAFTPVQGIELVDPTAAAERIKKANDRYFGGGGFVKVGKKKEEESKKE